MKILRLMIILLLCVSNVYSEMKVAVCYWGLTRSTKKVYESHFRHFFEVLDGADITYDVFMHTWETKFKQRVCDSEIDIPIDYDEYKLLHPNYYQKDNQDLFIRKLQFSDYFYENVWKAKGECYEGEWRPLLLFNHLCALQSLKRVTDMVLASNKSYDLVIYIRPDAQLNTPFPVHKLQGMSERDVLIADFDHFEGYNDRFAVLSYGMAPIYGKRFDHAAEYRKTEGRIVAERYLKYALDQHDLQVSFIDFRFDLVRP